MILLELLEILEGLAILQKITAIAWLNQDAREYHPFPSIVNGAVQG